MPNIFRSQITKRIENAKSFQFRIKIAPNWFKFDVGFEKGKETRSEIVYNLAFFTNFRLILNDSQKFIITQLLRILISQDPN